MLCRGLRFCYKQGSEKGIKKEEMHDSALHRLLGWAQCRGKYKAFTRNSLTGKLRICSTRADHITHIVGVLLLNHHKRIFDMCEEKTEKQQQNRRKQWAIFCGGIGLKIWFARAPNFDRSRFLAANGRPLSSSLTLSSLLLKLGYLQTSPFID